jgi:fructokinase
VLAGSASGVRSRRPGVPITVVDTVGTGDTFSAALLAGLHRRGLLGAAARPALRAIDADTLNALLDEAALAAAITCSRRGANPPTAAEVLARGSQPA